MTLRSHAVSVAAVPLLGLALLAGCGDDSGGGEGAAGGSTSAAGDGGASGTGGSGNSPGAGGDSGDGGDGSGAGPSGSNGSNGSNGSTGNASASTGDATTTTGGGDAEPPGMEGMTAAHNAARAAVDPPADPAIPPLTWDPTIAATAQAYAENCVFEHSSNGYGENIFASGGSNPGPQDVVDSWTEEEANYDYANNSCNGTCGHYTQVVWAASLNLGCGHAACSTNSPFGDGFPNWDLWVCNYDPPGNFNGQRPY